MINRSNFNIIFLSVGLLAGVAIMYIINHGFNFGKKEETIITSNTVVNKIEKVLKVVSAEGHFAEIYDYTNTSHILSVIPSTKKALIIVNAKVLMGYDVKKLKLEVDEKTKEIDIISFPQAEILAIEPDLKYYNLENGLFNKFEAKDLSTLEADAKEKIRIAALKSELPKVAQKQMSVLMIELFDMHQWTLKGIGKVNEDAVKN